MYVGDNKIEFNLETYLDKKGIKYNMVGKNAMMCCPFHEETRPSFGINVKTGKYHCFSGSCGAKGGIGKFIQKIENLDSAESAEHWLHVRYGTNTEESFEPLDLDFGDETGRKTLKYVSEEELSQYKYRHPYLKNRGIEEVWQRRFNIGYDLRKKAITIPWYDRLGRCVGIKFRSTWNKLFWYSAPNENLGPSKITLFGINHVYRRKDTTVVIVESEIDAIYCWQAGFPAIALGTSSINEEQLRELQNTYVTRVIIATDNDAAGRKAMADLCRKLTWINDLYCVNWKSIPGAKDINDLTIDTVIKLVNGATLEINHFIK